MSVMVDIDLDRREHERMLRCISLYVGYEFPCDMRYGLDIAWLRPGCFIYGERITGTCSLEPKERQ